MRFWNILLWALAVLWAANATLAEFMDSLTETEVLLHHMLAGLFLIGAVIADKLDARLADAPESGSSHERPSHG